MNNSDFQNLDINTNVLDMTLIGDDYHKDEFFMCCENHYRRQTAVAKAKVNK